MEESEAEDVVWPCAWVWVWTVPWWPSLIAAVEKPELGVPLFGLAPCLEVYESYETWERYEGVLTGQSRMVSLLQGRLEVGAD